MVNILGDAWEDGDPNWSTLLSEPNAKLHLYGKAEARKGRKMGHFCVLHDSAEEAFQLAQSLKAAL